MNRMRSLMKCIALVMTAAICLVPLTGCGKGADAEELGKYYAVSYEMSGMSLDADDDSWFELKEKGKVSMNLEGTEGNGKYEIDGDDILLKMDMGFTKISGTIDGSTIVLDLSDDVTMTFRKEGAEDEEESDGGSSAKYGNVLERLERAKDGESVYGYGEETGGSGLSLGGDDYDWDSDDWNIDDWNLDDWDLEEDE